MTTIERNRRVDDRPSKINDPSTDTEHLPTQGYLSVCYGRLAGSLGPAIDQTRWTIEFDDGAVAEIRPPLDGPSPARAVIWTVAGDRPAVLRRLARRIGSVLAIQL